MIFAISTDSNEVCPHFGKAPHFSFITIENNKILKKEIKANHEHTRGNLPKFIVEQGAMVIITGGMGRRAIDYFKQYGIKVVLGVTG